MLHRASRTVLKNQNISRISFRSMITSHIVVYTENGEPQDVLKTQSYQIDETKLEPQQVVVKTLASPVNPSDINQIQGVYPLKPKPTLEFGTSSPASVCGNEGLVEVLHVGKGVETLKVGDWCIPAQVNFGTWRTHAVGGADDFIAIPNPSQSKEHGKPHGLTVNQGATISVNPLTAYLMLTHYVQLTPGKDWFIQNGGNSAVGKYASQIGKLLGLNSISVVRDRENLSELVAELESKGATHVITEEQNGSREFGPQIKKWTLSGDVKLALNCVGGKNATGVARKLSPNGLMLTYGGMSFQPVILPTSLHIFKNITSSGFWVTALLKDNMPLKLKTLNQIISWYEEGKLEDAPSVETLVKSGEELGKVYQEAVKNSKNGKQLITYQ